MLLHNKRMSDAIHILPVLKDNYTYIIEAKNAEACVIDPGEAQPVLDYLENRGLRLTHILNTHHHGDHTAGNSELKAYYKDAILLVPEAEKDKIAGYDLTLSNGEIFHFHEHAAHIIAAPGHTAGGICFYFESLWALFSGDTLFSMGCGRLFEGTPAQMWRSLETLAALPDETLVYPGHEYTLSNGRFCLSIEPDNAAIHKRLAQAQALVEAGRPSIPVTLGIEKNTNVFLRAGNAQAFARLRELKDRN